jgi:TIR domain
MAMPTAYQIGLLGHPNGHDKTLIASLDKRLADLGIDVAALSMMAESDIARRDRKKPFIGVFFGYRHAKDADHPILRDLIEDSVVIVPLVPSLASASAYVPKSIGHINCLQLSGADAELERLVTVLFENFQLLRAERRLFVSYRRIEAQGIAIQLYEKLDAAGFDVFLDTRGVPPAVDFQSVLWHRLADSDVIVLLDTPRFRESRWTREELARANATSIQILHMLWPGGSPDATSAFSEFYPLDAAHFVGADHTGEQARLREATLSDVCVRVESLRARALASRHRYLVDNFCDQARALGRAALVQSSRFVSLEFNGSKKIAVVPAVGVPNAARHQQIETAILAVARGWRRLQDGGRVTRNDLRKCGVAV